MKLFIHFNFALHNGQSFSIVKYNIHDIYGNIPLNNCFNLFNIIKIFLYYIIIMATKLKIIDSNDNFFIIENLELELKLNLSSKSIEYVHIGDYIYDFFNKINLEDQPLNILKVTNEQFEFLSKINKLSLSDFK